MSDPIDLPGILSDAGISKLKSMRPGHQEQIRCPRCEGGKRREVSLSVKIDPDGEGATWHCWRGTCGYTGGGRTRSQDGRSKPAPPQEARPIVKPAEAAQTPRPQALYRFFDKRGISAATVEYFGCYVAPRWFPASGDHAAGEYQAIVFPYRYRGELVNRKYRPPHKNPQMQDRDALPTIFNIDALVDAEDDAWVVWCEGEPDIMACHEAGWPFAISLKDGAPDKLRDEDDPVRQTDKRFAALETHAEDLQRFRRIILAGDNDRPGEVLREELARRLGRHRVWTVRWPEDCKDAGDVLRLHGPDRLTECLSAAEPWPIEGVQRITSGLLTRLRERPPPPVMSTGTKSTDGIMKLPAEGRLIVVTGVPNSGKSSWVRFVMIHTCQWHKRRWACFSPEHSPWEQFAAECAEVFIGKTFWRRRDAEQMTVAEIQHAESWLSDRVFMLTADTEDNPPTLDWFLDRLRRLVLTHGVTDALLDPWNELEHTRPDKMSETEWVGLCLQRVKAFVTKHGVNVWIVAHPTKQLPPKPGGKLLPPGGYDIAGGANWANKTDLGITVHNDDGLSSIYLWKSRFSSRWGRKNASAKLEFDLATHRYLDLPSVATGEAPPTDLFGDIPPADTYDGP